MWELQKQIKTDIPNDKVLTNKCTEFYVFKGITFVLTIYFLD